MTAVARLWRFVVRPRTTSREILRDGRRGLRGACAVVVGFGLVASLLFLKSHFAADYPPPAEQWETWLGTWGEFAMLPFVKIPPERYRLAQAAFMTPLALAIWMLMAGSARLLVLPFGGRRTFDEYLSLFAYSFFAFWILGSALDILHTLALGDLVVPILRGEHGPVARALVTGYGPTVWCLALGLGGVYNGIAVHESEEISGPRAALVGLVTLLWPVTLLTLLIR